MTDADQEWFRRQRPETLAGFKAVVEETYPELFVPFAPLQESTGLDRVTVRRACRLLARRGLVAYSAGLWNDGGLPAGAGYGVTEAGQALASEFWETVQ